MNENIYQRASSVTAEQRRAVTRQQPMVLWFTGLSGSGKSTVASEVERRLTELGMAAYMLDGDTMRAGLCSDLGFSPADRAENIRRLTEVAYLLADSGQIVLVQQSRRHAKAETPHAKGFRPAATLPKYMFPRR